jgi:hypothetical protein
MTRRKGEITGRTNERDYPFIVEMLLPEGGFGKKLDAMEAFHQERGVEFHRGRSFRRVGGYVCRWCFGDSETAEAFRAKFGGIAFKLKRRLRYRFQNS